MVRGTKIPVLLAAVVLLYGCQAGPSPVGNDAPTTIDTAVNHDPTPQEVCDNLFPGGLGNAACKQYGNIVRQFGKGEVADAQAKAFDQIGFAVGHFLNGMLLDSSLGDAEDVLVVWINLVLEAAGLGGGVPDGAFDESGAFAICDALTECVLTTPDGFAGVDLGIVPQTTVVGIGRLADQLGNPFADFGFPEVESFPLKYQIFVEPEPPVNGNGETFGLALAEDRPFRVGVCVLDPPHSEAPSAEQLADLRIAHPVDTGDGFILDIAPTVNVDDLVDCTGVNAEIPDDGDLVDGWLGRALAWIGPAFGYFQAAPLYARPGRLGGAISAFSPFAAVDQTTIDGGDVPTTTDLVIDDTTLFIEQTTDATVTVTPTPDGGDEPFVDVEILFGLTVLDSGSFFLDGDTAFFTIGCFNDSGDLNISGDLNTPVAVIVRASFPGSPGFEASGPDSEIVSCGLIIE